MDVVYTFDKGISLPDDDDDDEDDVVAVAIAVVVVVNGTDFFLRFVTTPRRSLRDGLVVKCFLRLWGATDGAVVDGNGDNDIEGVATKVFAEAADGGECKNELELFELLIDATFKEVEVAIVLISYY